MILIDMPHFTPQRIDAATYHAIDAVSSSWLKRVDAEGWAVARYDTRARTDSRALVIGSAVHAVIEGTFAELYRAAPAEYRTANSAKFDAFTGECEAAGQTALTLDEFEMAKHCGEAILAKIGPWSVGKRQYIEGSLTWTEPTEYGPVSCKCRPDILQVWSPTSIRYYEIKTSRGNGLRQWKRDVWTYGYWLQESHYEAGLRAHGIEQVQTIFLVVRKDSPHIVRAYETDPLDKAVAARRWRELIEEYARREAQNDWDDDSIMSPTRVELGMRQPDDLEEVESE